MSDKPKTRWGYEHKDVEPRLLGIIALSLTGFLILSAGMLLVVFPHSISRHTPLDQPPSPAPQLQVDPAADLARFRAVEDQRLSTYGWADSVHRRAHIPIDEAMRRVAATGIADWPKASGDVP
ncbi:MAG TPA: hypothetical protein VMQ63_05530 [Stellaceae bacterium]|jgi:hypothetical protein|nr:hypothetical protein [Stellaceae bacterium]